MSPEFAFIRVSFAKMFYNVQKEMVNMNDAPSVDDIKQFLEYCDSSLKAKLAEISTLKEVIRVIRDNCSLINVVILEAVVEQFEITGAQKHIDNYKDSISDFSKNLSVRLCLNESFDTVKTSPPLKCETATYTLDWEPDEHKLKDITDILSKSSGKHVKLIRVKEGNSITVTCTFPHSLTGAIITKVMENIDILIKNGLISLTIGYCAVWARKMRKVQICAYTL